MFRCGPHVLAAACSGALLVLGPLLFGWPPFVPDAAHPGGPLTPVTSPAAAPEGWFSTLTDAIERAEYQFSSSGDGSLSAPNRAHDLRIRLGEEGVSLTSRAEPDPRYGAWQLTLRLTGVGREGALLPVRPARPAGDGDRVEYRRATVSE